MPNRLLNLVLCVLVSQPQSPCVCQAVGRDAFPSPDPAAVDHTRPGDRTGHARAGPGRTPPGSHTTARTAAAVPPRCPRFCHSHREGNPGCPHSAAEWPESRIPCDPSDAPPAVLPVADPRPARVVIPARPPGTDRVPLYLTFCSLRN